MRERCGAWTPAQLWRRAGIGTAAQASGARADDVGTDVLPLVQLACVAAFIAALAVEVGAAIGARGVGPQLFAPPPDAGHPFVPVFVGLLGLPWLPAGVALALTRIYRRTAAPEPLSPALRVAVLGALPFEIALIFYPLPFGGPVLVAGAVVTVAAWASGCRALAGATRTDGAQCIAVTVLAAVAAVPMAGALLATLA